MRIEPGTLEAGRPVLVLLSGGRDSVCLLSVAVEVCGAEATTALHVDYGLREDSGEDARICAALCERLGVALRVERPRRPEGEGGNLQAWARDTRYGLAAQAGCDVATGHTATDQVETVLYRLASSPSRRALRGMAPRSGRLVRPLLGVTRHDTQAYCRERGLAWCDDPSNATDAFARGRVRHGVVPALRSVHPAAEANVLRLAELLRAEGEVLDALVDEVVGGAGHVSLDALRALPAALARLVVVRLAEDAAPAGRAPRAGSRAAEILALDAQRPWTALDVGDGVRAVVERGRLRFEAYTPGPCATPPSARSSSSRTS